MRVIKGPYWRVACDECGVLCLREGRKPRADRALYCSAPCRATARRRQKRDWKRRQAA